MRFIICIIFILTGSVCTAQNEVKGTVTDAAGQPVDGAIVRAIADSTMMAYTLADENGHYAIQFKTSTRQITVSAEYMGYETVSRRVNNASQTCNMTLKEKNTMLKEVVVKAPSIYQRGDTLSYKLSAYAGQGDYTLKDAMKKLPGIEVGEKGDIKYLGKEISNFYIDGLDMLGGKYNIATSNIPASYVNSVQVLNNHQAVKMDHDVFSDDVAININMSNHARFKPMGSYVASGGYGDDWLYQLSGAGMLFKTGFQTIATLKMGNIDHFSMDDDLDHFGIVQAQSYTAQLMGNLSASTPPIDKDRYASPTDRLITSNFIKKLTANSTFRGNIGYSYSKSRYDYSLQRNYYDGKTDVIIDQQLSPLSVVHKPSFSMEYKNNSSKNYLNNTLSGSASILRAELPTVENGQTLLQKQSLHDFDVKNDFAIRWIKGDYRWNMSSSMQYIDTPTAWLRVIGNHSDDVLQDANGTSFQTKNTISSLRQYRNMRLCFPIIMTYSVNKIQTALQSGGSIQNNDVRDGKLSMAFAPQYEYSQPQRKYVFRAELPLRGDFIDSRNHTLDKHSGQWFFSVCPSIYLNYTFNARSVFRMQTSYTRSFGDILDFLTSPVQIDNTTQKVSSGILSENKKLMANLHYDYKIPLAMWFVNADVMYTRDRNNLLASQTVVTDLVQTGSLFVPNTSNNLVGQLSITKRIESIKTRISLRSTYLLSRQMTAIAEIPVRYTFQSVAITPVLDSQPCKYIELDYNDTFSKTFSRYQSVRKSYLSQVHFATLKLMPIQGIQLTMTSDITRKELTADVTKTMVLMDFGIAYQHGPIRLNLDLHNALNQHEYSYTVYDAVNTFTHNYRLRGRECVLTFTYTR
jgi:hypothetical protein